MAGLGLWEQITKFQLCATCPLLFCLFIFSIHGDKHTYGDFVRHAMISILFWIITRFAILAYVVGQCHSISTQGLASMLLAV